LTYLVLAFGTIGLSALAYAEGTGTGVLKLPQDIEFKSPLTGPLQTVVLYGDPTKPEQMFPTEQPQTSLC